MTDKHHATFKDFIEKTPWENYGRGRDPRCEDCMVHVGYEPSAVLGAHRKLGDNWKMLSWQLRGKMGGARNQSNGPSHGDCHGNGHGHSNELGSMTPPPSQAEEPVSADGRLRVL